MTNTLIKQIEEAIENVWCGALDVSNSKDFRINKEDGGDLDEDAYLESKTNTLKHAKQELIKAFTEAVDRAEPQNAVTEANSPEEFKARAYAKQGVEEFKSNIKEEIGEL